MSWYYGWRPYVPVGVRRARAQKEMQKLRENGLDIQPVEIQGGRIARTFWGQAWCDHLESFSDYENRLPRGRTYVRNGSVCHLDIARGQVNAMVSGSELYNVKVAIKTLPPKTWKDVKTRCAGQIGSLLELLQGRLSSNVMSVVTDRDKGLFPLPGEISLKCSCPDWAVMCKHVAAVLYGVGARLDEKPELLFLLRGLDHEELISAEAGLAAVSNGEKTDGHPRIAESELSHLFGIEITAGEAAVIAKQAPKQDVSVSKGKKRPSQVPTPKVKSKPLDKRMKLPKAIDTPRKKREQDRAGLDREGSRLGLASKKSQASAKKAMPGARKTVVVTGKAVTILRKKYNMSQAEFARLLDVSPATVGSWEKSEGPLSLRASTRKAWDIVSKLRRKETKNPATERRSV